MSDLLMACLLSALAFVASAAGTGFLLKYVLKKGLLDEPNQRSSHTTPTPRGGGVAIVATFLVFLAGLTSAGFVPAETAVALGGCGALVALTGFWDDHGHIAARWRLLIHFAAGGWLLAWFGAPNLLGVPEVSLVKAATYALAVVGIAWLINLYNFMDGIDGIASVEAITTVVGVSAAAVAAGTGGQALLPLVLAGAVGGFLVWNWPPARIFMGDAGSGFLGAVLAGLALAAADANPKLIYAWAIMLGVFTVDATVTLIRRAIRRERIYEAHRSHAYQRASRLCGGHRPITIATGLINLLWLAPLAVVAATGLVPGPAALAVAYAPLLALAAYFRAGTVEQRAIGLEVYSDNRQ